MWQTQDHNQDQSDLDKNDSVPLTTSPARSLAGVVVNVEQASLKNQRIRARASLLLRNGFLLAI